MQVLTKMLLSDSFREHIASHTIISPKDNEGEKLATRTTKKRSIITTCHLRAHGRVDHGAGRHYHRGYRR